MHHIKWLPFPSVRVEMTHSGSAKATVTQENFMVSKYFILRDQHKTLHNTVKIILHYIIATGTNLPNHLLWQTVTPPSLELKVTPCVLSQHQNAAGGNFWFHDFYIRSLITDQDEVMIKGHNWVQQCIHINMNKAYTT